MATIRLGLALGAAMVALLLALPIVALGLPFWLTALLVRALAGRLQPSVASWPDLVIYDPVLGWRARPDSEADVSDAHDDVFRIRTGPDGWHGKGTIEDSDVVVLGDSHAFGFGVDADATFAAVSTEPRIKALGAPGYNMVQELLLLRAVEARLAGKTVVWLVYAGNDIYDNLAPAQPAGQRTPFVRRVDGEWQIVSRHVSPELWTASSGRGRPGEYFATLAALHGPTHLAQRAYGACAFLIEQGAAICHRAGTRLVVMSLPAPFVMDEAGLARLRSKARQPEAFDPDRPDHELRAICAKARVEFVALKDHLRRAHFKATDDHLTEAGHRVLAEVIRSLYGNSRHQQRPQGSAVLAKLVHLPKSRALIVVQPEPFKRLRGVSTIPLADGRAFLAFDDADGLAGLEAAILDQLEDAAVPSAERAQLTQVRDIVRAWRSDSGLSFRTKSIIVAEGVIGGERFRLAALNDREA